MAIATLCTERLVSDRGPAVAQWLRLVASGAGQSHVVSVQRKLGMPLVVENQLSKAVSFNVTLRATHRGGRAKLADVRVAVTGLAIPVDGAPQSPAPRIGHVRPAMAIKASSSGVSSS
jgi:hypothetical protein